MIQRKQTIFLLLAIVCFAVNAALPIGLIVPDGMGVADTINCLGVVDGETGELAIPFMALPLVMLALNIAESLGAIFMYKNRKSQMTVCLTQFTSIIIEYIVCGVVIWKSCIDGTEAHYQIQFAICLPVIAMILIILAYKGIQDDERLVRAADRIR